MFQQDQVHISQKTDRMAAAHAVGMSHGRNGKGFYHTDNRPPATVQLRQNNRQEVKTTSPLQDNRPKSVEAKKQAQQNMVQRKANNTGLPDRLKSGIENISGYAMDDVKVHYNSPRPVQLNAHAYAQGNQIHVAPGQEKHLAHEAWHVVQQKQGRVKPTLQLKGKTSINDDAGLEKEADTMGAKALGNEGVLKSRPVQLRQNMTSSFQQPYTVSTGEPVVQRVLKVSIGEGETLRRAMAVFTAAYRVGINPGHPGEGLVFELDPALRNEENEEQDGVNEYGRLQYVITEQNRSIENDGIGAHLIGKIIDDGNVLVYFGGEYSNDASPLNVGEADAGRPSGTRILMQTNCTAIELIHELIHAYHFGFDPWEREQREQDVITGEEENARVAGAGSMAGRRPVEENAEEASTVGLGQWVGFALTENAFRDRMGLARRNRYTGWVEPAE